MLPSRTISRIWYDTWDAWWDNRLKFMLPVTDIEIDFAGTLYRKEGRTIINVDKQQQKEKSK